MGNAYVYYENVSNDVKANILKEYKNIYRDSNIKIIAKFI